MKTFSPLQILRGHLLRDVVVTLVFGGMLLHTATAANPGWWQERGVFKAGAGRDDYAALNQGQFKNFVRAAIVEMNDKLPNGAGPDLNELLATWRANAATADMYAAVNQGQVKMVVKKIYDRLKEVGYATQYPWSHGANAAEHFALANIGQLKHLLNFEFDRDLNRDGVIDWLQGAGAAAPFDPATWLSNAGSSFFGGTHHSQSGELGYTQRGGPTALPPNAESIENDPVATIPQERVRRRFLTV